MADPAKQSMVANAAKFCANKAVSATQYVTSNEWTGAFSQARTAYIMGVIVGTYVVIWNTIGHTMTDGMFKTYMEALVIGKVASVIDGAAQAWIGKRNATAPTAPATAETDEDKAEGEGV